MSISLEQLSAQMRRGEQVPLRHTMQVVLTLSIPSILQQIVVTAVEYIDAAMVGHIGASATASIGIVSSSTWLMHGMLAGLYMSFAIQVAQYLGADRQNDARGVLRQSMIFNLVVGLAAAAFGIGISRFLPGWLEADVSLHANASAYFAIWSASLPFLMIMGTYSSMLRSSGDALTPGLISVLTCVLDVIFNFCLINPTREMVVFGRTMTVWGLGWGVPGAALGTALATAISGVLTLAILLLRDGPLCIHKPGSWHITKACLQNLWKVGAPLAAERAVLSCGNANAPSSNGSMWDVLDENGNIVFYGLGSCYSYYDNSLNQLPEHVFVAKRGFYYGWMDTNGKWLYCQSIFSSINADDEMGY